MPPSPHARAGTDTLTTILVNIVGRPIAVPSKINRLPLAPPIRNGFENAYTWLTCQCRRAAAIAFAKKGAKVVVTGRRDEAGKALVKELRSLGSETEFINADVRKEDDVRALVDKTVARFGPRAFQSCVIFDSPRVCNRPASLSGPPLALIRICAPQ